MLYSDLLESTYESVQCNSVTRINELPRPSVEQCLDEEDRAFQTYLKARSAFLAAVPAAHYQKLSKAIRGAKSGGH